MRTSWIVTSLVFVGCQFQASCGGHTLNSENLRKFVGDTLAGDVGAAPDKVTCPAEVAVKKDAIVECTADYGGTVATVKVRQKDDQANVEMAEISGILVTRKAEEAIVKAVGEQAGLYVSVDCGPRVRPANAGSTFTCKAKETKSGAEHTVEVQVKDAAGNISFKVVQP